MKCVITEHDGVLTDQTRILREQTNFYKKLYALDANVRFSFLPEDQEKSLTEEQKQSCDQLFTINELYDAVMTMKSGTVPGLDGLTIEFYRKFWKLLAPELMSMYLYSYKTGVLPESVKQGLLSLLPKKNKDTRYVKNMSHFSYTCKMRCPLNLVLESWEYLWFYLTFWIAILDCGLKLHKLSIHTLVMLQK